jgi:xanthosine utilization system XapX-like protein
MQIFSDNKFCTQGIPSPVTPMLALASVVGILFTSSSFGFAFLANGSAHWNDSPLALAALLAGCGTLLCVLLLLRRLFGGAPDRAIAFRKSAMSKRYVWGLAAGLMLGFAVAILIANLIIGSALGIAWAVSGTVSALVFAWSAPRVTVRKTLRRGWPFL